MSREPHPSFFEAFNDRLNELMVDALSAAYDTACDLHDPDRGCNELTFGFNLYQFAVHEIQARADGRGRGFSTCPSRFLLPNSDGQWRFGCYRVGQSQSENIATSFPRNDRAAGYLVEQRWLPELEPDVSKARTAVLAHFGNSIDGFCAAHWAIPTRIEKDKISEWGYWKPVWSLEVPPVEKSVPLRDQPEDEIVSDRPIRRKRPAKADDRE